MLENYGNPNLVGLTSLEFYDKNNQRISSLGRDNITCQASNKRGGVAYLLTANHTKKSPDYMWLVPYRQNDVAKMITIKVNFYRTVDIKFIKIYNYNVRRYIDCGIRRLLIKGHGEKIFSPKDGKIFHLGQCVILD